MANAIVACYPIFQNFLPVNVAVTLTITNASSTSTGAHFAVAPAGSALPFTNQGATLFTVYANQTVTVTFDVPTGAFICNNNATASALVSSLTYVVEDILWGRG
jgi:hypothetical protein